MIQYGLWQSVEDIDNHLTLAKSETQKREALKIQLRFRKTVLQQVYPARLTFDDLHTCSFFRSYMFWKKTNLKDKIQYCYIRKPTVDTQINGF